MKKLTYAAAVLTLLLGLTACGGLDAGIISGEDGPTAIVSGREETENTGASNEWEAPPEEEPAPEETAPPAEGSAPESDPLPEDPGTSDGEGDLPYEDGLPEIDEDGSYNSAEDVSLYLYTFGCLPENYITKNEARDLGWSGGSVEKYAPGCAIGGDRFGNREGVLPEGTYHECDIDTIGQNSRGAKRLVYADDGRIYYTEDHYETFTLLYGEE